MSRGSYKSDGLKEVGTNTPSHCFLKAGASGPSQPVSLPVPEHYYTSKGPQVTWLSWRLLQPTLQQYTAARTKNETFGVMDILTLIY